MKNFIQKLKKLETWQIFEILFYPLILIYRAPEAWIKTLLKSIILLEGHWSRYMGFHPRNALNSFFYRTQWLNIDRYGRSGISHEVGLGNYPLSRWFHLSNFSSYIYSHAAAVTTLVGTLIWSLAHIAWISASDAVWVTTITLILLFSTTSYAMAFSRQNYNILGWMWLPLAFVGTLNEFWLLAGIAWSAAALGSITSIILSFPVIVAYAIWNEAPEALLSIIPAIFLLALHLRPLLMHDREHLLDSIINIAKLIGANSKEVRYKRRSMRLSVTNLYFLILYVVSVVILSISTDQLPIMPIVAVIIFLINQRFLRIADDQSVILLFVTVVGAYVLNQAPNAWSLFALWLAASPLPWFLAIAGLKPVQGLTNIVCHPPFDHFEIEKRWEDFFSSVPSGSKVCLAFDDPQGHYEKLFDGYRVIIELPLYVASKKKIHLFPDWHAVGETNYIGAPECWGRGVQEVLSNLNRWHAGYAVIYVSSSSDLDQEWREHFDVLAEFDWASTEKSFIQTPLWGSTSEAPKFFLLKIRADTQLTQN